MYLVRNLVLFKFIYLGESGFLAEMTKLRVSVSILSMYSQV